MKKDDTTNASISEEEARLRRSAAAKKAAATRRAKAEAARKAEEEAKAKAEAEDKSSAAAVAVDGTGASATATADTTSAEAKVADNGTKAEASSSAIIVLPAGDTGKNDANPSAQYVAPATYSETTAAPTEGQKGGTMKKVLSILGWVFALILVAILVVVLLSLKGCNGTPVPSATPSAISATTDAEAKISALSAALSAQKAENEALREQLSATQAPAPVNVNVDNSNTVVVDNTAIAEAQAEIQLWQNRYYEVFEECSNLQVINGDLNARCSDLEDECACLRAREPGTSVVYVDRDVIKTVTVVDNSEVDRLTAELASVKADLAWALDQLAKLQEAGPAIVYRDREVVKTVKDTAEIDRLNSVINSLNARIAELEAQISSHVCPEAGVEYVEVQVPVYIYVPVEPSGTPAYNSQQPEAVWPGEGDGSTITSPDRSGGSITGGN